MERRLVLQGIGAGLLVGAGLAIGADPKKGPTVKNTAVEQLQSTWKSLLAKDAKVAADASPIVRSDDEWRKSLDPASYAVLRARRNRAAVFQPAQRRASRRRVRLRRLRAAVVHVRDEVRQRHRLAELFHDDSRRVRNRSRTAS